MVTQPVSCMWTKYKWLVFGQLVWLTSFFFIVLFIFLLKEHLHNCRRYFSPADGNVLEHSALNVGAIPAWPV